MKMKGEKMRKNKDRNRDRMLVNLAFWTIAIVGLCICFFFCGYIFNVDAKSTETYIITDIQNDYGNLKITYTDKNGKTFSDTIPVETLEKIGLLDTANIVDWNTDGKELAVMTENGYEWYAYQSAEIYENRAFVPVESVTER